MTTVCRAIADEVNKGAAPNDVVTPRAIRDRVSNKENGRRESIVAQCNNEPEPKEKEEQPEMQTAEKPEGKPATIKKPYVDETKAYYQAIDTVSKEFAQAETMTTVCRAIAAEVNKDAAPQDKVKGDTLRGRVQRNDGTVICTDHADKQGRDKSSSAHSEQMSEEPKQEDQPEMQDKISESAIKQRVLQRAGEKDPKNTNRVNEPEPKEQEDQPEMQAAFKTGLVTKYGNQACRTAPWLTRPAITVTV